MTYLRSILFLILLLTANLTWADSLWEAAKAGDLEQIKTAIDAGIQIDALHEDSGRTALMEAADHNQYDAVRLLVELGADLEAYDAEDSTALSYAARSGDVKLVSYFLSVGAEIDGQRAGGNTPLMHAARSGSPQVLQLLIDKGADIEFKTPEQIAVMHTAVLGYSQNKPEKVKLLAQAGADLSPYASRGWTPAMMAISWGHEDVVQMLIGLGVSPNESTWDDNLLTIALKQSNYRLARWLVDAGASLEGDDGFSAPLAFAVSAGEYEFAKHVIEQGAPVKRYGSGLFGAVKRGRSDCVELLCEHGALFSQESWLEAQEIILERSDVRSHIAILRNIRLKDAETDEDREEVMRDLQPALDLIRAAHEGKTDDVRGLIETVIAAEPWAVRDAMTYAKNEGRIDTAIALQPFYYRAKREAERKPDDLRSLTQAAKKNNTASMKRLLERGADPNYGDKKEHSPIMISIRGHHTEMVKLLLDNGADPNKDPGWNSRSPLAQACGEGTSEIVKLLLDAGADPNAGGDGFTPLYFAASRNNPESTRLLIKAGAQINLGCPGFEKRTALLEATVKGHVEMIKYLIEQGADPNQPDTLGITPLKAASQGAKTEIAKMLLSLGATPPADTAGLGAVITHTDVHSPKRIKTLVSHGADPNALTKNVGGRMQRPLGLLLHRIYPKHENIKAMLDAGADLKLVQDPWANITTMQAETIDLLLDAGADINHPGSNECGARPLHVAAADGNLDLMRQLLDAGADPKLRTTKSEKTLRQYIISAKWKFGELYREGRADRAVKLIEEWETEQAIKKAKESGSSHE